MHSAIQYTPVTDKLSGYPIRNEELFLFQMVNVRAVMPVCYCYDSESVIQQASGPSHLASWGRCLACQPACPPWEWPLDPCGVRAQLEWGDLVACGTNNSLKFHSKG